MPNTTTYSFGDVILVPFPFTDQPATKKRSAVVISRDAYNKARPDVILMAVTSHLSDHSRIGEVIINDWKAAGLLKASTIKPLITTIEKNLIIRRLGQLSQQDLFEPPRRIENDYWLMLVRTWRRQSHNGVRFRMS